MNCNCKLKKKKLRSHVITPHRYWLCSYNSTTQVVYSWHDELHKFLLHYKDDLSKSECFNSSVQSSTIPQLCVVSQRCDSASPPCSPASVSERKPHPSDLVSATRAQSCSVAPRQSHTHMRTQMWNLLLSVSSNKTPWTLLSFCFTLAKYTQTMKAIFTSPLSDWMTQEREQERERSALTKVSAKHSREVRKEMEN